MKRNSWVGSIIFGICIVITFFLIGLVLYGFWLLWGALATYGILGIIVFLIFLIVTLPIIIIIFILTLIPAFLGICAID